MSLNYLKKRAIKAETNKPLPKWVSDKNITKKAYECINKLKSERLRYIEQHNKAKDYLKKSLYQISASEVAKTIEVATTTLISTSKYSDDLKNYLDEVNQELEAAKEKKLEKHLKTLSVGTSQRKKDEILLELQKTRAELDELKKRNALEQAKLVLDNLPLPIKCSLGLNV